MSGRRRHSPALSAGEPARGFDASALISGPDAETLLEGETARIDRLMSAINSRAVRCFLAIHPALPVTVVELAQYARSTKKRTRVRGGIERSIERESEIRSLRRGNAGVCGIVQVDDATENDRIGRTAPFYLRALLPTEETLPREVFASTLGAPCDRPLTDEWSYSGSDWLLLNIVEPRPLTWLNVRLLRGDVEQFAPLPELSRGDQLRADRKRLFDKCGGNITAAAKEAGVYRQTFTQTFGKGATAETIRAWKPPTDT